LGHGLTRKGGVSYGLPHVDLDFCNPNGIELPQCSRTARRYGQNEDDRRQYQHRNHGRSTQSAFHVVSLEQLNSLLSQIRSAALPRVKPDSELDPGVDDTAATKRTSRFVYK
jgi:hypothetical protein